NPYCNHYGEGLLGSAARDCSFSAPGHRCGVWRLWQRGRHQRLAARCILCGLLIWQVGSSVSAATDFLSYFNFLAGRDPSRTFVAGCDLDCGQDLVRLSRELRARRITQVTLALWTRAGVTKIDMT